MLRIVPVAALLALLVAAPVHARPAPCANGYVGLTFDDGPSLATPGLLEALTARGLRATMFDIGRNVAAHPDLARAQADAGMWIGNHTADHVDLRGLSTAERRAQIEGGQTAITDATGRVPGLLRPPAVKTNRAVRRAIRRQGLVEVLATVDSRDYLGASVEEVVAAARRLDAGGIMLMHDWAPASTAAVPRIARVLARKHLCAGRIRRTRADVRTPNGRTVFHAVATRPG